MSFLLFGAALACLLLGSGGWALGLTLAGIALLLLELLA